MAEGRRPTSSAWLARGHHRLGRPRQRRASCTAAGRFVLETIAGELPDELGRGRRGARAARLWLPFTAEVADALLELAGARFDERALRCAQRLQVGLEPAPRRRCR